MFTSQTKHLTVLHRPQNCLNMEIVQNGPQLLSMSAKNLVNKDLGRYLEHADTEETFDVGIRHKELRNNKIFSEILPNKMTLMNCPEVVVKHPIPEEKVRKWSLSNIYKMLRIWLRKHLERKKQAEGFEQIFYTGEIQLRMLTFIPYFPSMCHFLVASKN